MPFQRRGRDLSNGAKLVKTLCSESYATIEIRPLTREKWRGLWILSIVVLATRAYAQTKPRTYLYVQCVWVCKNKQNKMVLDYLFG